MLYIFEQIRKPRQIEWWYREIFTAKISSKEVQCLNKFIPLDYNL